MRHSKLKGLGMKVEVTIKTVAELPGVWGWVESHPGIAAWLQALAAVVSTIGVIVAVREYRARSKSDRLLRGAFRARLFSTVLAVKTVFEEYSNHCDLLAGSLKVADEHLEIIDTACNRPDWLHFDLSLKTQRCRTRIGNALDLDARAGRLEGIQNTDVTSLRDFAGSVVESLELVLKQLEKIGIHGDGKN